MVYRNRGMGLGLVFMGCVLFTSRAQCPTAGTPVDPSCPSLLNQGFCYDTFYTVAERQKKCGEVCELCITPPAQANCDIYPPYNSRCPIWASNGFCDQTFYSDVEKLTYCCEQCKYIQDLAPSTECAVIYANRQFIYNFANDKSQVSIKQNATVNRVFVKDACTLALTFQKDPPGYIVVGNGDFINVPDANVAVYDSGICSCA